MVELDLTIENFKEIKITQISFHDWLMEEAHAKGLPPEYEFDKFDIHTDATHYLLRTKQI